MYLSKENLSLITKMFFNNVISPSLPDYYDKYSNSFRTEKSITFIRNECSNFLKEHSFINKDKFFDFIIDSITEFESMNIAPKMAPKIKWLFYIFKFLPHLSYFLIIICIFLAIFLFIINNIKLKAYTIIITM